MAELVVRQHVDVLATGYFLGTVIGYELQWHGSLSSVVFPDRASGNPERRSMPGSPQPFATGNPLRPNALRPAIRVLYAWRVMVGRQR